MTRKEKQTLLVATDLESVNKTLDGLSDDFVEVA